MECLKKLVWNNFSKDELEQISIQSLNEEIRENVLRNWDLIAKPLDGMGKFEKMIAKIGAIQGSEEIDISRKAVIIMCADNGVVEEGISQSGQEITAAVARNMGKNRSSVGKMAKWVGADTIPVDIGINSELEIDGVLCRKISKGTNNFRKQPAMIEVEAIRAIAVGIDLVADCKESGYKILATGEMGIGNTTTSSAVAAAILKCEADKVTGRGAGLSDKGLIKKQKVITEAIRKYDLYHEDTLSILEKVGGFDIAGLAGVCIGGALYHMPIVLDGVISLVAALVAEKLVTGTKEYLIPSHKGKEPAVELLEKELGIDPVIEGGLALGEGTGAVMMFSLLDLSLCIYNSNSTFQQMKIEQYQRLNRRQ